jgi:hypothetical protein
MTRLGKVAVGGVALAVVIGAGDRGAAATFEAVEITVAVVLVLAVAGLAALIIRARGDRRIYRQEPPGGPLRVRAVVVGRTSSQPSSRPVRAGEGGWEGGRVPTAAPFPPGVAAGDRRADAEPPELAAADPGEGSAGRFQGGLSVVVASARAVE